MESWGKEREREKMYREIEKESGGRENRSCLQSALILASSRPLLCKPLALINIK